MSCLINAKKLSYNIDTYYTYIQRKSSVQNSVLTEKKLDLFKALNILEERVPRNDNNKLFWDEIIFNQILMFLIYVIPREKNSKNRKQFINKFNKLSKKYNIFDNKLWIDFLKIQGKKHLIYYKFLTTTMKLNLTSLTNSSMNFYHWYTDNFKKPVIREKILMDDLIMCAKKQKDMNDESIKLSVVIPNYNYEKFLFERLYSILNQKIKIYEIIILDDCSSDNSRKLIDDIENKLKDYISIKKIYNEKNSGSAFKQWQKGFSVAKGDYVWIAEADDYSDSNFLKEVLKPMINDKDIVISYSDTAFIDKLGYVFMRSIKKEIDIMNTGHWDRNFINDGKSEIHDYSYLNCTIANVSSVICIDVILLMLSHINL